MAEILTEEFMFSEELSSEDDSAIHIMKTLSWETSQLKKRKYNSLSRSTKNDRVSSPSSTLLRESGEKGPFLCRRNLAIAQTWHATTMKIMITIN